MEIYPLDIVLHIVNIAVLYILLRMLLFKPVRRFMQQREQRIQAQMEEALEAQRRAEAIQAEYNGKLAEAEEACRQMLDEGRRQHALESQQMITEAEAKAREILVQAREEAESQKAKVLDSAKGELTDLAVSLAGRILQFDEEVTANIASDNRELKGSRSGVLKVARPCSEEEAKALTARLEAMLGCRLELTVQVDESLIGGYAAFVDGKVYDFSYAAQLGAVRQKLS